MTWFPDWPTENHSSPYGSLDIPVLWKLSEGGCSESCKAVGTCRDSGVWRGKGRCMLIAMTATTSGARMDDDCLPCSHRHVQTACSRAARWRRRSRATPIQQSSKAAAHRGCAGLARTCVERAA
jgi:hypothetical protein